MSKQHEHLTGQCQCGYIRYRINGSPLTFYTCHCLDCQKQSSSAFGLSMWFALADFELSSGQLKFWSTEADDGTRKDCAFCPQCGTRIYHAIEDGSSRISLKAGTLEDISQFEPVAHIWTKRAHPWLDLDEGKALNYPDQPESFHDIFAAWQARGVDLS